MVLVTDYDSLQDWVATVLNRDDLTDDIPNMIQDAEAALRRDERARLLVDLSPFATTEDQAEDDLPSDFDSLYSLAHEGPTYYGEIDVVGLDQLADYKIRHGTAGPPHAAAVIPGPDGHKLRWAPTPNDVFNLRLAYWSKPTNLSDSNTSNRFLSEHPDIYRYATMVEAAVYLKDPELEARSMQELDKRLNALYEQTQRELFGGGTLTRRPDKAIG